LSNNQQQQTISEYQYVLKKSITVFLCCSYDTIFLVTDENIVF
jgi:hypothetical protein